MRAWQLMFAQPVDGPIATVDGTRLRVLDATLDDPGSPEAVRLDAADGPLWLTSVEHSTESSTRSGLSVMVRSTFAAEGRLCRPGGQAR